MRTANRKIGTISKQISDILGTPDKAGKDIYIGDANITHMKNRHFDDYQKYGKHINEIVNNPDFVGINPKDQSIEYVKEFHVDDDFVKVAVRVSSGGYYYARTLYVLKNSRVNNFIAQGTLKMVKN